MGCFPGLAPVCRLSTCPMVVPKEESLMEPGRKKSFVGRPNVTFSEDSNEQSGLKTEFDRARGEEEMMRGVPEVEALGPN